MTVEKLIEEYEWSKRKKRDYDFGQHIKMKYMPYAEKCAFVKSVLDNTSYVEIAGKKTYKRNTAGMMFVFTMQIIAKYTDLEFSNDEVVKTYDVLMETGLMNELLAKIPEEEYSIILGMLNMQRDDEEVNTRSLISFFETKMDAFQMAFDGLSKAWESPEIQAKIAEFTKAD